MWTNFLTSYWHEQTIEPPSTFSRAIFLHAYCSSVQPFWIVKKALNKLISWQHAAYGETPQFSQRCFSRHLCTLLLIWIGNLWHKLSHIHNTNSDAQKERGNPSPKKTCPPWPFIMRANERVLWVVASHNTQKSIKSAHAAQGKPQSNS